MPKRKPASEIRRRARVDYRLGDQVGFQLKSFTKPSGLEYNPVIDCATGEGFCDCDSRRFRPKVFCKHIIRCAVQLIRRGELSPSFLRDRGIRACYLCGGQSNLFGLADDHGNAIADAWVCGDCVLHQRENTSP